MLEDTIKELTREVRNLTAIISHLRTHELKGHNPQADDLSIVATEVANEPEPQPEQVLDRDELQALCLRLVKEGKASKEQVKALTAMHGGKLLKDIPDANLPAFAAELRGLDQ